MFDYSLDLNVWLCSTTQIDFKFLFSSFLFQVIVKIDYLNISSSYSLKKKKKLFISSSNFSPPSLPFYLPTTLYFTIKLPSSFSLSYILTLLLPILFCTNLISLIPLNPYFFYTKIVSTLSLSLSLSLNFCSFL